ncbi:MAG: hypothetical protein ACFFDT_05705 [Candidatus Hodarchaeota archaeon]
MSNKCSACGKDLSKYNLDFNKEIMCRECISRPNRSVRSKFIRKKYSGDYIKSHLVIDPDAIVFCSICCNKCKQPHWAGVIACLNCKEKTGSRKKILDFVEEQSSRSEKILEKHANVIIFGKEINTRKIKDKAYFVNKTYEILSDLNVPLDAETAYALNWNSTFYTGEDSHLF